MMFYNSQPAWNRRHFFKIEKQFTQYRLLINHNKYTFHYIIRNKYWNIKPNTGFPHGCHRISLLTLYALAQLIRTIGFADATGCLKAVCILPLWHVAWQVTGPSYSSVAQNHPNSCAESSDYSDVADICSLEVGQISVIMQEQRAQGNTSITAALFTEVLQSSTCWAVTSISILSVILKVIYTFLVNILSVSGCHFWWLTGLQEPYCVLFEDTFWLSTLNMFTPYSFNNRIFLTKQTMLKIQI